jgi:hypothetical protein
VYFELLHERLADHLRGRIRSGELTERQLARLAGISQPHLHNVLKGVRVLSAATADVVVTNLRLSALDLVREDELEAPGRLVEVPRTREAPLAAGLLGPGHPFPDLAESTEVLTFPVAELRGIAHPVAVRLAADPQAPPVFHAGDIVLLELLPPDGPAPQPGAYYVIDAGGCGLLRRHEDNGAAGAWAVRARAVWIGRDLRG